MKHILPTGNVKPTNVDGSHGKDDAANMPASKHMHMPPGEKDNPQNLNHFHWRKAGTPGGDSDY